MLRKLLMAAVFLCSGLASAQFGGGFPPGRGNACWNAYDVPSCSRIPGCIWERSANRCQDSNGGGGFPGNPGNPGNPRYGCSQWHGNAYACQQEYGCSYDYRSNACLDDGYPNPNPGPNRCANIYDPRQCDRTPGCAYDTYSRSCQTARNPNPNPNPWPNPNPNPYPTRCEAIYDAFQCNRTPGCSYDSYFNQCRSGGIGGGSRVGWCAGGPYAPSDALGSQQEALACARQIARGGRDCAQSARFGQCDLTNAYVGWQANPSVPRCTCLRDGSGNGGLVNWLGSPARP